MSVTTGMFAVAAADDPVLTVLQTMVEGNFRHMPVVDTIQGTLPRHFLSTGRFVAVILLSSRLRVLNRVAVKVSFFHH